MIGSEGGGGCAHEGREWAREFTLSFIVLEDLGFGRVCAEDGHFRLDVALGHVLF